jgi:uncharacterized protein HemX
MSHQPPVPEANSSPYPIQEPPHVHAPEIPVEKRATATTNSSSASNLPIIGAVLAFAAAGLGAALYLLRSDHAPKKKRHA